MIVQYGSKNCSPVNRFQTNGENQLSVHIDPTSKIKNKHAVSSMKYGSRKRKLLKQLFGF